MKKLWLGVPIIFIVLLAILINIWRVRTVECVTQFGTCAPAHLQRLQYLVGQKMWPKPKFSLIEQSLASFPEIKVTEVTWHLPSTIRIQVDLRSAMGIVNNLVVDDGGRFFAQAMDSTLPRLQTDAQRQLGEYATDEELAALKIIQQVVPLSLGTFSSKLQAPVLTITTNSGLEVVFNVKNVPSHWADSLQLILARSRMDTKVPHRIDLRFNDPVVTF